MNWTSKEINRNIHSDYTNLKKTNKIIFLILSIYIFLYFLLLIALFCLKTFIFIFIYYTFFFLETIFLVE